MGVIPAIDYDPEHRWLVVTEWLGSDEYGASAIVARDVSPEWADTIRALVAAVRAAGGAERTTLRTALVGVEVAFEQHKAGRLGPTNVSRVLIDVIHALRAALEPLP